MIATAFVFALGWCLGAAMFALKASWDREEL
jgi:hypothetical protein